MSNKTRKYIWPVSLAMSLALVGVLAAFVVLAGPGSQSAEAHGPCDFQTMTGEEFARCVATGGDVVGHTHEDDMDDKVMDTQRLSRRGRLHQVRQLHRQRRARNQADHRVDAA